MQRLVTIGAACVALAAFGAGCGDDDDGDSGEQAAAPATTTPAEEAPAQSTPAETEASSGSGKTITVEMKDFAFTPAEVDAKVGDTVKWVNEDDAPHNAVQEDGDLKTKTFEKGGSDTYTIDEAGTINYICTVHPNMKGTIVVAK